MHVLPKQNIPRSVAVDSGTRLRIAKQDGSTNVETSGRWVHLVPSPRTSTFHNGAAGIFRR